MSLKTREWKMAYRIIFWSMVGIMMIIVAVIDFMPLGEEKKLVRNIGIGIGIAAMINMVLYYVNPAWFKEKVKVHPNETRD